MQRALHVGEIRGAVVRQREAARQALEQLQAEHVLEMAHLLRDGALRDADLVGGGAELRCRADTSNARSAFSGGRREGRGGIVRL